MGERQYALEEVLDRAALVADGMISALVELSTTEGGISQLSQLLSEFACATTGVDGVSVEMVIGSEIEFVAATGLLDGAVGMRFARDSSLSGIVIATAQTQFCRDTCDDPRVDREVCKQLGIGSMAVVPIRREHHTVAVMTLASRGVDAVTQQHVQLIEPLVTAGAARLMHVEAAELAAKRWEMLNTIASASKEVLLAADPGQRLVEAVSRIVDAPHVWLMLPDDTGGLTVARTVGADLGPVTIGCDDTSLVGTAFTSGRAQIVTDWSAHPKVSAEATKRLMDVGVGETRSAVFIPLETPDGPAGVVCVMLREPITANNAELLGLLQLLAAEAGITITRYNMSRRLADQARTDPLTGAANRRVWEERLDHEVEVAKRSGLPLTVALLDLDHFKRYNDRYGHLAGDELLRQVVTRWSAVIRPTDLLARLGGEEFGILLPDADAEIAAVIMQRLGAAVPFEETVSIGITVYRDGEDPAYTMRRADDALYAAKSSGRDQIASQ